MTLTPESLDRFATTYYLSTEVPTVDLEELAQQMAMPRIVEAIGGAKRVLEMGFGTGLITKELLAAGVRPQVVEGSALLCAEARKRHEGLVVHHALFETFEPPELYDCVLALHVIEHVDDPQAMLAVIRAWVAPGGKIVVVAPNCESLHRRIAVRMGLHQNLDDLGPSDHLVGHQRVYSLPRMRAEVESAGFAVQDEFGYLLKTVPNSMMLAYPPQMVRALNAMSDEIPAHMLANIGVVARKI
jgi:2-polyprenyl-3-methyl-5-hydroxy-6-metoxy-1,4-benzoquinol methylase